MILLKILFYDIYYPLPKVVIGKHFIASVIKEYRHNYLKFLKLKVTVTNAILSYRSMQLKILVKALNCNNYRMHSDFVWFNRLINFHLYNLIYWIHTYEYKLHYFSYFQLQCLLGFPYFYLTMNEHLCSLHDNEIDHLKAPLKKWRQTSETPWNWSSY